MRASQGSYASLSHRPSSGPSAPPVTARAAASAGRAATRAARGRNIPKELAAQGVIAKSRSREGLAEEQPAAYKDVDVVVDIVHRAGLSLKVARLRPLGVIKG